MYQALPSKHNELFPNYQCKNQHLAFDFGFERLQPVATTPDYQLL